MPNITVDGKEYDVDSLSKDARDHLASLQFVSGELQRLNAQIAVLMTARATYARAFDELANKAPEPPKPA